MAVAISKLLNDYSATLHGTGSFTTDALTVPNNCILVAHVVGQTDSGSSDVSTALTISDSLDANAWTSQTTSGNASSWAYAARMFTKQFTTGGSATITVDCGANNIYEYVVTVIAVTGHDTGTPVGATASNGNFGTDGAASLTLSGTPSATSAMVGFLWRDCDKAGLTVTQGTGWTEEYDTCDGMGSHCQTLIGLTSTTVPWADITSGVEVYKSGACAIEIKEAGGGTSSVRIPFRRLNVLLRLCLSTFTSLIGRLVYALR